MDGSPVIVGDCRDVLPTLPDASVDAVITDPPYEIGYKGNAWDRTGIAFQSELWREVCRVLRPGAFVLTFGATRTWHRLAVALEDAGLEIRDTIVWLRGNGYPKSPNVLRPAWEPIIMARRPGTSVLNIDDCRIPDAPNDEPAATQEFLPGFTVGTQDPDRPGRWPTNVLLDDESAAMVDRYTRDWGTEGVSRFFYVTRASVAERDAGLDDFPLRRAGGLEGMKRNPGNSIRAPVLSRNPHPTIKPIALLRYLVRLVTVPGGTVLDPFTGSGSTGCAAVAEGRQFVGIERDPEYAEIARARVDYWARTP